MSAQKSPPASRKTQCDTVSLQMRVQPHANREVAMEPMRRKLVWAERFSGISEGLVLL